LIEHLSPREWSCLSRSYLTRETAQSPTQPSVSETCRSLSFIF
jgi:hypothetical protein